MYKKSLLSYTVAVATILISTHSNTYAQSFFAGKEEDRTAPTGESYENIYALDGGKIHGKDLKITGIPIEEGASIRDISGAEARKSGSLIDLEGNTTIKNVANGLWARESGAIKMTGGSIQVRKVSIQTPIGIESKSNGALILNNVEIEVSDQDKDQDAQIINGTGASIKSNGTLNMTNGSIRVNHFGAIFEESDSDQNKLENVKIDITNSATTQKDSVGISAIKKSKVTLKNIAVTNAKTGVHASDNSQITVSGGSIQGDLIGIHSEKESKITLKNNVKVLSNEHGLSTDGLQTKITMTGGTLTTSGLQSAVFAVSGGHIDLTDVGIHIYDNRVQAQKLQRKDIQLKTQGLQAQDTQSKITMTRGSITATGMNPAILAVTGGQIRLNDVSIKTDDIGLQAQGQDSKITMTGGTLINTGHNSVLFATRSGQIDLTGVYVNTDGNGMTVRGKQSKITLKNSKIHANILLIGVPNKEVSGESDVIADHSILEGAAKDSKENPTQTIFNLINGTTWYLKVPTKSNNVKKFDQFEKLHSTVSVLNLKDSSIIFNSPTEDHYQTLHIGTKTPNAINVKNEAVYNATGNAKVYLNAEWTSGAVKEQQKNDRFLVHGNASGTTTIHFNNLLKSEKSEVESAIPPNKRGFSLVQVSGKANETTFKLANGYTTIGGLPYKYTLNSYGPTSSLGKADAQQNLLGNDENFWDFRLQKAYLDSDTKIRALVPQVASYLVMPNVIFSAGFTDVNNQNTLLDSMTTKEAGVKDSNKKGIFLSSYGQKSTLSSNRNPLQYGYGADILYTALQTGITLAAHEDQNIATHFGILGTYSKLAFTPKGMEGSEKNKLDKWSLTPYSSVHHNSGLYVNTLFSYGVLKGNITTALIGNTAKLDDSKTLTASTTIGQKLKTTTEGLVFEPQAQFVYQRLILKTLSDVDGFKVDMGTPHQWLLRVGGRLTQTVLPAEKDRSISFYGKLNVMKAFRDNATIKIGDTFDLDSMASSIEGGLGVNASLSQNITFHADVNYQHKLKKAGISGVNVSGGMHYRF
ncbi:autotransporter outer membrane beta-barrel domain-containing protein [Bartonella sp. CB169]|uniref:autotransporter outer membrane beta-barrel domain-containing protein n=1 Tax=Bartonella sp. CB169 TaxID=3112257 RepID=UPI00300E5A44